METKLGLSSVLETLLYQRLLHFFCITDVLSISNYAIHEVMNYVIESEFLNLPAQWNMFLQNENGIFEVSINFILIF